MVAPYIYSPYVVIEKLNKKLCYKSQNTLYGTWKASFLFYRNLITYLLESESKINLHDVCVANKIVNGKKLQRCLIERHEIIAS